MKPPGFLAKHQTHRVKRRDAIFFYTLVLPIFGAYWLVLHRLRFDARSMCILLAAFLLGGSCLFHIGHWILFSADWFYHAQYIEWIETNEHVPLFINGAARHPPLYYVLAAGFLRFGKWMGDHAPLDYVRYLALILFSGFWTFAALTLRRLFPERDTIYYLCLVMMAFWPVGITKVTVLGCDVLLYMTEMATLYFLICWLEHKRVRDLTYAVWAAAFTMLSKNNGIVMIGLVTVCVLVSVWRHRRQLRQFIHLGFVAGIGMMILATYFTLSRDIYSTAPLHEGSGFSVRDVGWMYLYFDPVAFVRDTMINPMTDEPAYHFWHYYLRSLLVGDYIGWRALSVLFAFGFLWQAMLLYMLWGVIVWQPASKEMSRRWYFLGLVAALLTGMLMYRFYTLPQPNQIADGRYVYPIIVIIVGFYGRAVQWHRDQDHVLSYRIGLGLAQGFVLLSIAMIVLQDYVLDRPI